MGLEEIWKPILNYEDRYEVSTLGRVKSLKTQIILQAEATKDGYLRVRLWNGENYKSRMVHCLVAETFIPLPDNKQKYEVDHIDNDVTNNIVNNLQWLTHQQNLDKSHSLGNQKNNKKEISQFSMRGEWLADYPCIAEAFRQTGIRHISECASGKRMSAGGYLWKYKNN